MAGLAAMVMADFGAEVIWLDTEDEIGAYRVWQRGSGADPRTDISSIKVFVPMAYHRVVDRAIQVFGAKGVTDDTPLERMYRHARYARIYDGPDEVHRVSVSRRILRQYEKGSGWDFGLR